MSVTHLPPRITCHCGQPMRLAKNSEISMLKRDPITKTVGELSIQGNSSAIPKVPEWQKNELPPNTWLMICDLAPIWWTRKSVV